MNQEVKTINGYTIKDEKAIRTYDTVALMKTDRKLKEGQHVKTRGYYSINDGGGVEYYITDTSSESDYQENLENGLYATLLVKENTVNILQCGAKNNNSTDVGTLINTLMNIYNYKIYVPLGEYLVTNTINPSGEKTLIIKGNLTYSGNDSCIKIDSKRNYVETRDITASNGVCVLLENNDTEETRCQRNIIKLMGTLIANNNHCLYLHSIKKGIAYNEIYFDVLRAKASTHYAIYIKTESEDSSVAKYVNENTFYGGRCSRGLYGIYIDTNITGANGECNGLKFYNICLEGVTNGIYLNNARSNNFVSPRVGELSGHYLKLVGSCDGNNVNFLSLVTPDKIDVSEMTNTNGWSFNNFIDCEISTSGGTRFGRNFIASNRRLPIERLINKFSRKNITDSDVTEGEDDNPNIFIMDNNQYSNYLLMNSTLNPIITLNGYYGSKGINELYISEQGANKPFKLYDSYGSLVEDYSTPATSGLKHFICVDVNHVDTWIEV